MYAIEKFGTITLSPFNNSFPLSPVPTKLNLISTASGVFDNDGEGRSAQQFPFALPYTCVVTEDIYNDNRAVLDELREAVGTRDKLYRRARNDNTLQWCIARLSEEPHDWPYKMRGYFELTLNFQQMTPWYGLDHVEWRLNDGSQLNNGLELDTSVYRVSLVATTIQTIVNGGNLPVDDVLLTINTGANPLSNVSWITEGIELKWIGTIPANSYLQIDTGARSVIMNGDNAYDGIRFGGTHQSEEWMILKKGSNLLRLQSTGTKTGATWAVNFRDLWA